MNFSAAPSRKTARQLKMKLLSKRAEAVALPARAEELRAVAVAVVARSCIEASPLAVAAAAALQDRPVAVAVDVDRHPSKGNQPQAMAT